MLSCGALGCLQVILGGVVTSLRCYFLKLLHVTFVVNDFSWLKHECIPYVPDKRFASKYIVLQKKHTKRVGVDILYHDAALVVVDVVVVVVAIDVVILYVVAVVFVVVLVVVVVVLVVAVLVLVVRCIQVTGILRNYL